MEHTSYCRTPIGLLRAVWRDGALTALSLTEEEPLSDVPRTPDSENLQQALCAYFAGSPEAFSGISIAPRGSAFEASVWEALRTIPFGETRTYGEIATLIGKPGAARAVGGACHRNPILLAIPCHRVIGHGGHLTGFGAGMENKIKLLRHEQHIIEKEILIQ